MRTLLIDKSAIKAKFLMLLAIIIVLLTGGVFFYHAVEGWSFVDSFYFAATSLATKGYGDLHPATTIAKIFTAIYLFIGVALIIYTLTAIIGYYTQYKEPAVQKRMRSIVNKIHPKKEDEWIMIKPPKMPEQKGPIFK